MSCHRKETCRAGGLAVQGGCTRQSRSPHRSLEVACKAETLSHRFCPPLDQNRHQCMAGTAVSGLESPNQVLGGQSLPVGRPSPHQCGPVSLHDRFEASLAGVLPVLAVQSRVQRGQGEACRALGVGWAGTAWEVGLGCSGDLSSCLAGTDPLRDTGQGIGGLHTLIRSLRCTLNRHLLHTLVGRHCTRAGRHCTLNRCHHCTLNCCRHCTKACCHRCTLNRCHHCTPGSLGLSHTHPHRRNLAVGNCRRRYHRCHSRRGADQGHMQEAAWCKTLVVA